MSSPSSTTSRPLGWRILRTERRLTLSLTGPLGRSKYHSHRAFHRRSSHPADGFSRSDEAGENDGFDDEEKTTEVTRRRSFRGSCSSTWRRPRRSGVLVIALGRRPFLLLGLPLSET